ncbi:MAG: GTP cyclohydrolase 1 type 2 [Gemmatimonadaceae bacterium]|nr:GTP cyclohydrolase 1 type 2 [Gemmatimonadaceae bacterium]
MVTAGEVARYLDDLLETGEVPDYPGALNGLQLDHVGPVRGIAAAVDVSLSVITAAVYAGANLLVVHHGLFWADRERIVGARYERLRQLFSHDIAVYSSHLPLDAHRSVGNNALLANTLDLEPSGGFAHFQGVPIGVMGRAELPTARLVERVRSAVSPWGGTVTATAHDDRRITRVWGICTGAGASTATLQEAVSQGVDTLIVGEGPHHTAVDAPDLGLVVVYAGHYATETLGVQAIARDVSERFALPWTFVHVPSGL